ncbi:hypothetical protein PRECH8_28080 [Insulibacter thermoxylanivorax]|uniref:Bacterial Ig-like domain-containing protein n=1 Tax=Insulibacter thermoxylanivorax TaxID=2749268 RepID=A0A916QEY3_9BACL|nr:family 43 glycosylhydrolase [Insulibacter thermoxylanivorax]GFR39512.1 hypothetical protein PRECH8_28080 [Insulibacter thermoxylanivorax]
MKITNIREIEVQAAAGRELLLPKTVEVELEGGIIERYPVEWEQVDTSLLAGPGEFVMEGEIVDDDYPNPLIEQRADPYVLKHTDGYYYFTASVPEYDRIILRRAKTIAGLAAAEEKVIWRKHDQGEMGSHIRAPELHYIDGRWYIYFAAGTAEDKWHIRPYVLECVDENPLTIIEHLCPKSSAAR